MRVLFIFFICTQVSAYEKPILKQGSVEVTFEDVDGYAYTIPDEKRSGFFHSAQRIGSSLYKILNMKQIVHYGNSKKLIPLTEIQNKVNYILLNSDTNIKNINKSGIYKDEKYESIKHYYTLIESYKYMQNYYKNKIKLSDIEELAHEEYLINKRKYYSPEKRDINYIAVLYNANNKEAKREKAEQLLKDFEDSKLKMRDFSLMYKEDKDLIFTLNLNNYVYNHKFEDFSKYVFSSKNEGLIKPVYDANNRFLIVSIEKIVKSNYLSYEKAKEKIIKKLESKKFERDFNILLKSLTSDEVEINQEAIVSLKTRYIDNDK